MTRVLVVDDREQNLLYLEALLRGHGYEVVRARHGAEALRVALAEPPDLVVSDLLMPVMDGYTLLREWKADEALRHVPFIVYTATYTHSEDERLAWDLGADDFVLKPAVPEELLRHVEEVLGRGTATPPSAIAVDGAIERAAPPDPDLLQAHNERLIRKLEEKTLALVASNQRLQGDIEARRLVEIRLAEQARLLDQTQDAIVVHDHAGRVLFWNKGAERLHGWTATEAVGRPIAELHCPDTGQLDAALAHLEAEGEWSGDLRLVDRSGADLIAEARLALVPQSLGGRRAILAVHTDVTERRTMEAQFLRAQRSESIGTLAGGIAHDLNNLLAPIVTGAGLLRLQPHDEATDEILDAIEASAQRGTELVRQVLSFTRGIEGARAPVQVADVIAEAASIASTTFPRAVTVRADVASDLWPVTGDATQLHQVLLNLLVNARDALPAGGRIEVRARNVVVDDEPVDVGGVVAGQRCVLLEVTDDGIGMEPALVGRIFEPFLTTKERGEGSGLGLSTVQGIVRSHGGAVRVRSEPGAGTTFEIHLPASDDASPSLAPSEVAPVERRPSGERILVVDDEPLIVGMTRRILEVAGYRVVTADGGAAALEAFADPSAEIAAVVTDLEMPVLDGVALIEALRAIDAEVPILATSGGLRAPSDRFDHDEHLRFLGKPSTMDQLLELLSSMLAGRSAAG